MNRCEREGKEEEEEKAGTIPEKEMAGNAVVGEVSLVPRPDLSLGNLLCLCTGASDLQSKLPVFLPPLHPICSSHTKGYILISIAGSLPIANPPCVPL